MKQEKKTTRPIVEIKHNSYQPNKADLQSDLRPNASFDMAIKALTAPVKVKRKN